MKLSDFEKPTNAFIRESNGIEGIHRDPTTEEINEHNRFINLRVVTVDDLTLFVSIYEEGELLRENYGMDVRVGNHRPPPGNPNMRLSVSCLLESAKLKTPFQLHHEYESLHPFTDCNGRSGRALWAWHMMRTQGHYSLGFLHSFYYQSLDAGRK